MNFSCIQQYNINSCPICRAEIKYSKDMHSKLFSFLSSLVILFIIIDTMTQDLRIIFEDLFAWIFLPQKKSTAVDINIRNTNQGFHHA